MESLPEQVNQGSGIPGLERGGDWDHVGRVEGRLWADIGGSDCTYILCPQVQLNMFP